jgi:release factor glutamine methyltransferase
MELPGSIVTIAEALTEARRSLDAAGIEDAQIETEVLLRRALSRGDERLSRAQLYTRLPDVLEPDAAARFESFLKRRLAREPSAYITQNREFLGYDFLVTPAVLIPRPETETLIDVAIDLVANRPRPVIVDIGTGSGVVAVCLAMGLPGATVYAIDSSAAALEVAAANARRHGVDDRVVFIEGDLLEPAPAPVDLIVANLPYVRSGDIEGLQPEVRDYEPRAALDGGPDGLAVIRRLIEATPEYLQPGGSITLEFGDGQADALLSIAGWRFAGAMPQVHLDFTGRPRVLSAVHLPDAVG